jgi:DNA primase
MITRYYASTANVTLSAAELEVCKPVSGKGGQVLRALCPFHGSDHQRSLEVWRANGRFKCYACGAWGYTAEARQRWRDAQPSRAYPSPASPLARRQSTQAPKPQTHRSESWREPEPARVDLAARLAAYQAALPGSWGERYLSRRGISLELAQRLGIGYAAPDTWLNRHWKWGRVVFPHTRPDGCLVNLYGRAIGDNQDVPKALRHDHLPGDKGYFHARALREDSGPVYVSEGGFDALALMMAGVERAVAIFGTDGWRWEWAYGVRELVLAFDADRAGERAWRKLACVGFLQGKQITLLSQDDYGGYADANEAWLGQALNLGDCSPWGAHMDQGTVMEHTL